MMTNCYLFQIEPPSDNEEADGANVIDVIDLTKELPPKVYS